MSRSAVDVVKMARTLIADYGQDAENEAAERAVLLHAIGSYDEARTWLEVADHVAAVRDGDARAAAA